MSDGRPWMLDLLIEQVDVFAAATVSLRAAFDQDHALVAQMFPDEADFRRGIAFGVNMALSDVETMLSLARESLVAQNEP